MTSTGLASLARSRSSPSKQKSAYLPVSAPILEARNVNLHFSNAGENLHVLRDVSFALQAGEVASAYLPFARMQVAGREDGWILLAGRREA